MATAAQKRKRGLFASRGKEYKFSLTEHAQSPYTQSSAFGTRLNLFQTSIDYDTSVLDKYPHAVELACANALFRIAQQARDMARKAAPKQSGALRAGIYVTAPAKTSQSLEFREGGRVPTGKMKGHTSGYFRALNSAAKNAGYEGAMGKMGGGDGLDDFIVHRTQRIRKNFDIEGLEEYTSEKSSEKKFYQHVNNMLPLIEIGDAGRSAFYIGIGSIMYYSAWIEFGTSKMVPRPFFAPAARWMVEESKKAIASEIGKIKL